MSRAWLLGAALLTLTAGCTRRCKDDSLLVSLTSAVAPQAGDRLTVLVTLDANTHDQQSVTLIMPKSDGTLEIDFGSRYPRGKTITLEIDQQRGATTTIASNSQQVTLNDACEAIPFALHALVGDGGAPPDLSSADLSSADLSQAIADLSSPDLNSGGCPVCVDGESSSATVCLSGTIYDFVTNQPIGGAAGSVRVAAYDTLALVNGSASLVETASANGCYHLPNVPVPNSRLFALVVEDVAGAPTATMPQTAIYFAGVPGQLLRIDGYKLAKSVVDGWSANVNASLDGGTIDFYAQGAVVTQMYDVTQTIGSASLANGNANLASGVFLSNGGTPIGGQRFLNPARSGFIAGGTTGASGAIVVPSFATATVSASGGTCAGAACTWPSAVLGAAPHVVQIQNYYACGPGGC